MRYPRAGYRPNMRQVSTPPGWYFPVATGPQYAGYGDAIETSGAPVNPPSTSAEYLSLVRDYLPVLSSIFVTDAVKQVQDLENKLSVAKQQGQSLATINDIEAKLAGARHKLEVQLASEQNKQDLYNIGKVAGIAATGVGVALIFSIVVRALRS